jgi:ATP-dependent exoDNAse (exonuclease V) beta subunit
MSMVLRLSDAPETLEEARKLIDREEVKHRQALAKLSSVRDALQKKHNDPSDAEYAMGFNDALRMVESALANATSEPMPASANLNIEKP